MNCNRCQNKILKGEKYHRTKRGFHHAGCACKLQADTALNMALQIRDSGWLVTIKLMPREFAYIVQGARSEFDAPCEDKKIGKGKVCIEGMNMRDRLDWNAHLTFADTFEEAIRAFYLKICPNK